jgi:hypothetical protein
MSLLSTFELTMQIVVAERHSICMLLARNASHFSSAAMSTVLLGCLAGLSFASSVHWTCRRQESLQSVGRMYDEFGHFK